jgi:hypothetical protein
MRKLIAACLVVTALAAVPSMASAKPVLTSPTGTVAPVGTKIVGTLAAGTTSILTTSFGQLVCNTAIVKGSLSANSTASGNEGTITSVEFGNTSGAKSASEPEPECTGSGFLAGGAFVTVTSPVCVETTEATDTIKVRGGECGKAPSAIVFHLTVTTIFGNVPCSYQRTAVTGPLTGTLNTHPTQASATFAEQGFVKTGESGGECPVSAKIDLSFNSETEAGAPVYVSQ